MSTVTLMQGDCCEKLNGIPANSVNLVLADPPYGITHQAWDTVLPFEDFIEKDGKRLSLTEFLLSCYKEGIPYADAMSIWTENKQQGIWKQLDRILTENSAVFFCCCERANRRCDAKPLKIPLCVFAHRPIKSILNTRVRSINERVCFLCILRI